MKIKCQCPECHCTNEFEQSEEKSVPIHPFISNESDLDTEKDIRYLESKKHLNICPMCAIGEHEVFE